MSKNVEIKPGGKVTRRGPRKERSRLQEISAAAPKDPILLRRGADGRARYFDYPALLRDSPITGSGGTFARDTLPNYRTCNPAYSLQISGAVEKLVAHYQNGTDGIPLTGLILGPPGAGKTYFVDCLVKAINGKLPKGKNSVFSDRLNCATFHSSRDIFDRFQALKEKAGAEPAFIFLDEFDVSVAGTSVVRFLLDLITSQDYHRFTFVFSGSYLKSQSVLDSYLRNTASFDFIRFLHHSFLYSRSDRDREILKGLVQVSMALKESRDASAPDRDVLAYLRQLDKLRDFLSRINGFVIQLPDLSSPLDVTRDPLVLNVPDGSRQANGAVLPPSPELAHEVREFSFAIESINEQFPEFQNPQDAVLQYKNMLLSERLMLAGNLLSRHFDGNEGKREIHRSLLNYLASVPLMHGVRSLQQIISLLEEDAQGVIRLDQGRNGASLLGMHARREPYYSTPGALWAYLREANPGYLSNLDDEIVLF